MRSSIYVLFFVLQLFITAVKCGPLPTNDAANDELVKDENYDVTKYAKQVNEGVQLIGSGGYVDLVISDVDSLFVNVDIKNCDGTVLFCYAANKITSAAEKLCDRPGFCGFQLIGTDDKVTLTRDEALEKNDLTECVNDIKMVWHSATYCKDISDDSCNAAISTDAPFRIYIKSTGCRVIIKHATIYYPPTTVRPSTIPSPTLPGPSNNATTKDEKTSEASSGWFWIVLAVVFALVVTGIIVGFFLCWYKKWCIFKEKTAEASPPRVRPIVTTTVEKVAASAKSKSKKQKSKPPKIVETPSKEASKKRSPTLSLAPTPPTKSVKKPKEKKGASPGKKTKVPAKKSPALVSFPSSTEEEAVKKPKEKKAKTPPPPAAEKSNGKPKSVSPAKNVSKAEKPKTPPPASPGKKEKKTEVQPSAEPFSTLPIHPPTPPKKSIAEHDIVHTNRQPGQKGRYANSLELPSYSGGVAVPSKFAPPEWRTKKRRI